MGHIHLGTLPRTRSWQQVVALIEHNAEIGEVAVAAARSAEASLLGASGDPVFVEAVRLLLNIPLAARPEDFGDGLRRIGLSVGTEPSLLDVLAAATAQLDDTAKATASRTDLGEIAGRAMTTAIADCIGRDLPSLFGPGPGDVQASFRKYSRASGIATLNRSFFAALVSGALSYWLDRNLSHQIGTGQRFADASQRDAFDRGLRMHVAEATRIIQEFSGGWVGKTLYDKGGIATPDARIFGHVCLKKIVEELRVRRGLL